MQAGQEGVAAPPAGHTHSAPSANEKPRPRHRMAPSWHTLSTRVRLEGASLAHAGNDGLIWEMNTEIQKI